MPKTKKTYDRVLFIRFNDQNTTVRVTQRMMDGIKKEARVHDQAENNYVLDKIYKEIGRYNSRACGKPPSLAEVRSACQAADRTLSDFVRIALS